MKYFQSLGLILLFSVFCLACNKDFTGRGDYSVEIKAEGDEAQVEKVNIDYWDDNYNQQKMLLEPHKPNFKSSIVKVGRGIIVSAEAKGKNGGKVKVSLKLLKGGKVVREAQGEAKNTEFANAVVSVRTLKNVRK